MAFTKNTLWDKFRKVADLDSVSVNTIRRGVEHSVQENQVALANIKDIQSHSATTGSGAYYKTKPLVTATYMNLRHNSKLILLTVF